MRYCTVSFVALASRNNRICYLGESGQTWLPPSQIRPRLTWSDFAIQYLNGSHVQIKSFQRLVIGSKLSASATDERQISGNSIVLGRFKHLKSVGWTRRLARSHTIRREIKANTCSFVFQIACSFGLAKGEE